MTTPLSWVRGLLAQLGKLPLNQRIIQPVLDRSSDFAVSGLPIDLPLSLLAAASRCCDIRLMSRAIGFLLRSSVGVVGAHRDVLDWNMLMSPSTRNLSASRPTHEWNTLVLPSIEGVERCAPVAPAPAVSRSLAAAILCLFPYPGRL
jgi:hypothetical protein